jgi:hypothetical protein
VFVTERRMQSWYWGTSLVLLLVAGIAVIASGGVVLGVFLLALTIPVVVTLRRRRADS